jgi:hypothetical protein
MISNVPKNPEACDLDMVLIVSKAIARLVPATVVNFQNQLQQENIMESIFNLLMINNEDVRKQTLEALIDIIKFNYIYMGPYLDRFH